tara:strand:- start:4013 stop:4306 length:294 start_codon:yes stop_codon:yes gene_type:complete
MYAPIDRANYPREMELKVTEIQWLEKELRGHNANYQVGLERRVMGEQWEPEYKYHVLKWKPNDMRTTKTREVLLDTTDPDQVIATLKMLLSIEREPR